MNQYATMAGNICLDKTTDDFGFPAPVTFSVKKVMNGSQPWMQGNGNMTLVHDCRTLEQAMEELHAKFLLTMENRNFEFRIQGEPTGYEDDNGNPIIFEGETGWYDLNNPGPGTEYPNIYYPIEKSEWLDHKITAFDYDNYTVCIVTSQGGLVR